MQVVPEAAFFLAGGADQSAELGFEERFLAFPGAKQDHEGEGALRQFGYGWAAPLGGVRAAFRGFLWFSFGHDGGDFTPTGTKSNRDLVGPGRSGRPRKAAPSLGRRGSGSHYD